MMKTKKRNSMLRNAVAALLCLAQMMPAFAAAQTGGTIRSSAISKASSKMESDTLHALEYDLYQYGTENTVKERSSAMTLAEYVSAEDRTGIANSISIGNGQMYIRKDAYFDGDADAAEGIVKIEIDTVIEYANPAPIDVMFVLDHSGSMNMWSNRDTSKDNNSRTSYYTWDAAQSGYVKAADAGSVNLDPWGVPCMNPEHYYRVPLIYTDAAGSTQNAFVNVSPATLEEDDELGEHFSIVNNVEWWESFEDKVITTKTVKPEDLGVRLENGTAVTEQYLLDNGGTLALARDWKAFTATHYNRSGAEIKMEDALAEYLGQKNSPLKDGEFYFSPDDDDANGCYDRANVAELSIKEFAQSMLAANEGNRIGFVTFDAGAEGFALTRDSDKLEQIWENRSGALHTDYRDGLNKALELLGGETDRTRDTYVIFISDGMPSPDDGSKITTGDVSGIVERIKELSADLSGEEENYKFYAVGIQAQEAQSYLDAIADDEQTYLCNNISQFKTAMSSIKNSIVSTQVLIEDVLGISSVNSAASYELYVDESHPVTTQRGTGAESRIKAYTNTSSDEFAADGLKVNESASSISWDLLANTRAHRLTFYIQLKEALRTAGESAEGNYPTNAPSSQAAYEVVKDGVSQGSERKNLPIPSELRVKTASLTIEKNHSTAAKNEVGRVNEGDEITYTFSADYTGDGTVTFENVTLTDEVPAGMTLVSGDVTKNVGTIQADRVDVMSFTAKVSEEAQPNTEIPNAATFYSSGDPQAIANTNEVRDFYYKASAAVLPVTAVKELTGRELAAGEFTFRMSAVKAPQGAAMPEAVTAANDAAGRIDFGTLSFEMPGEYVFLLEEGIPVDENGNQIENGITYSTQQYTLTVTVTDDQNGQLKAEPVYTIDGNIAENVVFSNVYGASIDLVLRGTKEIVGREFKSGDRFTFVITGADGAPMPVSSTVSIMPTGGNAEEFEFAPITFTEADAGKTHIYTVVEARENLPGVEMDPAAVTLTVQVLDNGDGTLKLDASLRKDGEDVQGMVFRNVYHADGSVPLVLVKNMKNREFWLGDAFTFVLTPKDGAPLPVKDGEPVSTVTIMPKSGDSATVEFGEFAFTEADAGKVYTYDVAEQAGTDRRIIYDTEVRTFSIVVSDDGNGNVLAAPAYPEGGLTFTNEYVAPISITVSKVWNRPYGSAGMPEISFTLTREGDPDFSQTHKLSAQNNWTTTIADLDSDYTYVVEEVNAPLGYTATVTQEGTSFTITNTELPSTGDDSNLLLWSVLACVSAACFILLSRRRRTA